MNVPSSKILVPSVIIVGGLFLVFMVAARGQNMVFFVGALGVVLAGAVALLNGMGKLKGMMKMGVIVGLAIMSIVLASLTYRSIMDPIEFNRERDKRNAQVVQKLKDIRAAQLSYKSVKGQYAGNAEDLLNYLQFDSIPVVKSIGTVPDTLTLQTALEMGIVSRDTTYEPSASTVFNDNYMKDRDFPLDINTMMILPFTDGELFIFEAGEIERNKVPVQVFEVRAPRELVLNGLNKRLISMEKDLKVGSMTEPSTSGNWGE